MLTEKLMQQYRLGEWVRHPLRELSGHQSFDRAAADRFAPAFDVKDTTAAFVIKADLPSVEQKDVGISVVGGRLIVSGKCEQEKEEEGELVYAWQRSTGSFVRSFMLPKESDLDHVEAEMADGVLTVTVPKTVVPSTRKIALQGLFERLREGNDEIGLP